ncbi:hypothetical protein [Komagataeibacter rhaeticus]|uniref:Uncharacterized protein n=1 Tax=Komagataeibacter rhaeticus TaxID=215221 RepID=A0A858JL69_9PROT|nr:hypothetical protein [Komagataeibacter rhaeticus]QIP34123.1 hypothetical protein GWK63_00135 [Komagataeibacter rhaeticus]QOC46634.1 hypothetical protein ICJ78_00135 [Komagataeibacter rhaeticus]
MGAAFFQKGGVLRSFLKKASPKTSSCGPDTMRILRQLKVAFLIADRESFLYAAGLAQTLRP